MGQQDPQKQLLIFLSHAREDKPKVRNLYRRLMDDDFNPWLDEEHLLPGQNWDLEIEKVMRASDMILLCFSEQSVSKSGYIQREYKRAMDISQEKPEDMIFVIPVRLDDCEMPTFIRGVKWVDYPADYDKLLLALQTRSGGKAMPKTPAQKKQTTPHKPAAPKPNSGPVFNVQGNINIGRDLITGDQTNTYYQNQTTLNITTSTQFVGELQKLRDEIESLKSQSKVNPAVMRRMEVVQADIQDAIREAKKDKPVAERINKTLDSAKDTMQKLSGSISSAVSLGTMLGSLAAMALKLFGGG